jgi:hypothetical protein
MLKLRILQRTKYASWIFKGFIFFMLAGYLGLAFGILLAALDLLGVRMGRWLHVHLFGLGVLYTFLFSNFQRRVDMVDHRSVSDLLLKGALIVLIWGFSAVDTEDRH